MNRVQGAVFAIVFPVAVGCANGPFCSVVRDATGRSVAECQNPRAVVICDLPGETGRFVETATGQELEGALRATCSADDEIRCPPGTEGVAYCLLDPTL